MALVYNVYADDGAGGPVDYSAPVATVSGTSWSTPPLAAPGVHRFAVRCEEAGEEEANLDAAVRIELDGAAVDVSGLPRAPAGLAAAPAAAGALRASWRPSADGPTAVEFRVYRDDGAGGPVDYGAPAAVVPARGRGPHAATLAGLTPGASYLVVVRARNNAGEGPAAAVAATVDPGPPDAPDALALAAA